MIGDILSKLICCGERVTESDREPISYRHTEVEMHIETLTIKSNIHLTSDELGTAIKFYSLKHNKI